MTVFYADEPIEPKSIVACPVCGFEFCFNHAEGWSEEGYRFVCYRCRVEQAERERDEARREAERLRAEVRALRKRVDEWADRYSNLLRQYEALLRGATMWRRVRGE